MKYYRIIRPYYALICAENVDEAKVIYERDVSEVEEDTVFKRISKEHAYEDYQRGLDNSDIVLSEK